MYVIKVRNVCDALPAGVALLREQGVEEETRAGKALVLPYPVTTVIEQPAERVLFSAERDANPAFHLFESIWMLAGRNDVASLNRFIRDFGDRFGEPNGVMHGAYGHRWREAFGFDQLDEAVDKLKRDHTNRQAVIQMWDCTPKPSGSDDLRGNWKDRPCNTHIYLRVRKGEVDHTGDSIGLVLDLTICCRSNDVIWGAYGANAVHFSVLQEYLAARIGIQMGKLYQVSNNFHGYLTTMDKEGVDNRYFMDYSVTPLPMFRYPDHVDDDIADFMNCFDNQEVAYPKFLNPWFNENLVPAVLSYQAFRDKRLADALSLAAKIRATDWSIAFTEWYLRRAK